jgi:23S rRNA (cytidine1920-2'-O)/16S rRNA (cytidine1409-2'-O)-methyltransferase
MPDFASVDVSFISLSKILPPAHAILPAGGEMVCLIKPQFEAGREKVGKKGVVRDPRVHIEVIENVLQIAQGAGFAVLGLSWSPIRGPEGNIEYLMHLRRLADDTTTPPSAAPADPEGTLHQPAAESSAAPADAEGNVTDPAAAAPAPLSANSPADPGRLPTHEEICELVRKSHETL